MSEPLVSTSSSSAVAGSSDMVQRNTKASPSFRNNFNIDDCETQELSVGLVLSALVVVLSCGIIFLLGVNIVIQYRTINWNAVPKAFLKIFYIILSFFSIYIINKFNLYFFKKMSARETSNSYARINTLESIQMRTGVWINQSPEQ